MGTTCHPLAVQTTGGKQKINCASVKSFFRIIQSISSQKAESFKQWLTQVGYERMKELYEKKGYPKDWTDKRPRGTR